MSIGGESIDTYQVVRSRAFSILDAKILRCTQMCKNISSDIKEFFSQYMQTHRRDIPPKVLAEYNLNPQHFESKLYVYYEIGKEIYGLKEGTILAYNQLQDHLANIRLCTIQSHILYVESQNSSSHIHCDSG